MSLVKKADEMEAKIEQITAIKWPIQKAQAAERLVFEAVHLVREMAVELEQLKKAVQHGE